MYRPRARRKDVSAIRGIGAAACVALTAGAGSSAATAEAGLSSLAGTWSGGGTVALGDGGTERLTCRAYYTARDAGTALGVALRCASTSYKIDFRSSIKVSGGRVSGTWEERSFNAAGSVSGSASAGSISLSFSGTTSGAMSVSYGSSSQRLTISSMGNAATRVTLSLTRG
jgi:hypothetical protein